MRVKGWTEVFKGDRLHAEIVSAVLDANGMRVEVFGDNAYGIGINLTEARVMVLDGDASTARRLIEEAERAAQAESKGEV